MRTNSDGLIRELSGPRLLRRAIDIVPKPRTWSRGARAISLENQTTVQTAGAGKDQDLTYFNPTGYWCRPCA